MSTFGDQRPQESEADYAERRAREAVAGAQRGGELGAEHDQARLLESIAWSLVARAARWHEPLEPLEASTAVVAPERVDQAHAFGFREGYRLAEERGAAAAAAAIEQGIVQLQHVVAPSEWAAWLTRGWAQERRAMAAALESVAPYVPGSGFRLAYEAAARGERP